MDSPELSFRPDKVDRAGKVNRECYAESAALRVTSAYEPHTKPYAASCDARWWKRVVSGDFHH